VKQKGNNKMKNQNKVPQGQIKDAGEVEQYLPIRICKTCDKVIKGKYWEGSNEYGIFYICPSCYDEWLYPDGVYELIGGSGKYCVICDKEIDEKEKHYEGKQGDVQVCNECYEYNKNKDGTMAFVDLILKEE
jgi:NAD-dependent SIR2 family protein deacetylase